MTLPSRLEIVKAFADPSRELRRSQPGQALDWAVIRNATLEEGEDPVPDQHWREPAARPSARHPTPQQPAGCPG